MRNNITLTILLLFNLIVSNATTYYVDGTYGLDTNNGTSTRTAWQTISKVNSVSLVAGDIVLFSRGQTFRGNLFTRSGTASANVAYGAYGTGNKPLFLGSINRKLTTDWVSTGTNLWKTSNVVTIDGSAVDAGNLIFNNEGSVGWKVSSLSLVNSQGEFYSDVAAKTVTMYSTSNPGSYYSNIEVCLKKNNVVLGVNSYVLIENLDLRYTGAHAIGGSDTHHIIIKDVDMSFIGGSYQGGTTRYGNGVEFYNGAHDNSVDRCTFSQIYDAALTNQGNLTNCQEYNIYYRNNIIRSSEYSFEIWLRGNGASLHDIYFDNNTCLDAGTGWGHVQRIDPNGAHLCFWGSNASVCNIFIRNNIFINVEGAGIFESKTNLSDLTPSTVIINNNDWYVNNMLAVMNGWNTPLNAPINTYYDWNYYRMNTGKDSNSIVTNPLLTGNSISSNSPCVDTGVTSCASSDFIGIKRPQGLAYDMGAYEYSGKTSNSIRVVSSPATIQYDNKVLTLELSSLNANEKMQIFDVTGVLVEEYDISSLKQQFDIEKLQRELYFVKLTGNPQLSLKFLKQ